MSETLKNKKKEQTQNKRKIFFGLGDKIGL